MLGNVFSGAGLHEKIGYVKCGAIVFDKVKQPTTLHNSMYI